MYCTGTTPIPIEYQTFVSDIRCCSSGDSPSDPFLDFFNVALPDGTEGSKFFDDQPHFLYLECIFVNSQATVKTWNIFLDLYQDLNDSTWLRSVHGWWSNREGYNKITNVWTNLASGFSKFHWIRRFFVNKNDFLHSVVINNKITILFVKIN